MKREVMKYRHLLWALLGLCILTGREARNAAADVWIEVRSPNFLVMSNAPAKQARRAADRLEQFRNVIHVSLPKLRIDPGLPVRVFAARDADSFKALLPREFQKKGMMQPAGIFQGGQEKNFILLRLDLPSEQGYHVIYHEYVHMLMRLNFRTLPLWLSEGFADFFGQATLSDSESGIGRPSPEQIQTLQKGQLLPLDVMMAVDHNSPHYRQEDKSRLFYAQSWALTHYRMLGDKQAHAKQLTEYLDLILAGVPEPEAAARAYGDLKGLQKNLDQYIRSMGFYYFRVATGLKVQENQYSIRTLATAEYLATRGDLMAHTGQLEEAKFALEQALQLDPRNVTAHEAMGILNLRQQDRAQAAKYFTTAADLGSTSCMAQYYAAQFAYEQGGSERLGRAESYLRKAIQINPQYVPGISMLAQILVIREENRTEALELAKRLAAIEPAMITHQILIGKILLAMEKLEEASSLGQRLVAAARSEGDKQLAESFLASVRSRQKLMLELKQRAEEQKARVREAVEPPPRPKEGAPPVTGGALSPARKAPAFKVSGVIRSVKCDYPAIMDIVLDVDGGQIKLRAQNHYQVQYWAVDSAGKDNFQPCAELQGKKVQIEYFTALEQQFVGWINAVWIDK